MSFVLLSLLNLFRSFLCPLSAMYHLSSPLDCSPRSSSHTHQLKLRALLGKLGWLWRLLDACADVHAKNDVCLLVCLFYPVLLFVFMFRFSSLAPIFYISFLSPCPHINALTLWEGNAPLHIACDNDGNVVFLIALHDVLPCYPPPICILAV